MGFAASPRAPLALGRCLLRRAVLPIPPDVLLMPCAGRPPARAALRAADHDLLDPWRILRLCGGLLPAAVGEWLLSLTGGSFESFQTWYGSGRPADRRADPYKITAIASAGEAQLRRVHRVSVLVRGCGSAWRPYS